MAKSDDVSLKGVHRVTKMMLLRAACDKKGVAVCKGWSQRYADRMIEHYTTLIPEFADGVLAKIVEFEIRELARTRPRPDAEEPRPSA